MKKCFILIAILLSYTVTKAQRGFGNSRLESYRSTVRNLENENRFMNKINAHNNIPNQNYVSDFSKLNSSPFLYDEWLSGALILPDSTIIKENIKFKFNANTNEVWIKLDNGLIRILDNRELHALFLLNQKNETISLHKLKLTEKHSSSYFSQDIYYGKKFQLIKDIKKEFRYADDVEKGVATIGTPYDRYEPKDHYYIKKENLPPLKIKGKRNDLIKALNLPLEIKLKLERFAKEKDIHNKPSEQELILLLGYAEKLLSEYD
jgi:hypothetical protein